MNKALLKNAIIHCAPKFKILSRWNYYSYTSSPSSPAPPSNRNKQGGGVRGRDGRNARAPAREDNKWEWGCVTPPFPPTSPMLSCNAIKIRGRRWRKHWRKNSWSSVIIMCPVHVSAEFVCFSRKFSLHHKIISPDWSDHISVIFKRFLQKEFSGSQEICFTLWPPNISAIFAKKSANELYLCRHHYFSIKVICGASSDSKTDSSSLF